MKKLTVDLTKADKVKKDKFLELLRVAIKQVVLTGHKVYIVKERKLRAK